MPTRTLLRQRSRARPSTMTTHRFIATAWHNVLGTLAPALTVASGDTVITETIDAHGIDKDGVQRAPEPNPMNGPISVTGAEPLGESADVTVTDSTPSSASRTSAASCRKSSATTT